MANRTCFRPTQYLSCSSVSCNSFCNTSNAGAGELWEKRCAAAQQALAHASKARHRAFPLRPFSLPAVYTRRFISAMWYSSRLYRGKYSRPRSPRMTRRILLAVACVGQCGATFSISSCTIMETPKCFTTPATTIGAHITWTSLSPFAFGLCLIGMCFGVATGLGCPVRWGTSLSWF